MSKFKEIADSECQLVCIECQCGFHAGLDFTYLDQVGVVDFTCPACGEIHHIEEIE